MQPPHVIAEKRGALGLLTLNRPEALNALTRGMVEALAGALAGWAGDPQVRCVAIRGAGPRAFCAGGDVRAMAAAARDGSGEDLGFLRAEYRLNAMIGAYPKPYVALLHGFVMGGGAGISVHGRYRLADASLGFAMPETGIGFVADIGSSHFLPRCPGGMGLYLALTGARIGQGDACAAGLATHAVAAADWDSLLARLAAGEDAARAIAAFAHKPEPPALAPQRALVDVAFAAPSVEAVLERLDRDGSGFAAETARTLRARAPLALKYTFREMRLGAHLDLAGCLRMEFRMAARALHSPDFQEGVRAALVDKDGRPRWSPASLAAVTPQMVEAYFAPLDEELQLP
jgi:enoyl-CoA hydratase